MASEVNVPLGRSDYRRPYGMNAGSGMWLMNRFFESDVTSTEDDNALLARPGTDMYKGVGAGPVRGTFTQPGFMGGDLFVVSKQTLYRWNGTTLTTIAGVLSDSAAPVSMTYQNVPDGTQRLWIADGQTLRYYEGEAKARGTLVASGAISATEVVRIGDVYYEFVNSGVDTGSPAGTVTNPWKVLTGATPEECLENLGLAIDGAGTPGGTYSTDLAAHPLVETRRIDGLVLAVQARIAGAAGNAIVTTETGANMGWTASALSAGGDHFLVVIYLPDGADSLNSDAAVSVTALASYVIISVANSQRLYFIRPAEFWVDIWADAESEPDAVHQVLAVGDSFWALGQSTIEPWAPTGDDELPFAPIRGRAMSFGCMPGTAQVIETSVYFVDDRGKVRTSGGERISTHAIEEAIRHGRNA